MAVVLGKGALLWRRAYVVECDMPGVSRIQLSRIRAPALPVDHSVPAHSGYLVLWLSCICAGVALSINYQIHLRLSMDDPSSSSSSNFSAEQFFETQEPPAKLAHVLEGVKTFVTGHARAGRRVVLVTVGTIIKRSE